MRKKKMVRKITSGVIASLIALQGLAPAVTVLADESSQPEESIPVTEPCESEDTTETTEEVELVTPEEVVLDEPEETENIEQDEYIDTASDSDDYLKKISELQGSDVLVLCTADDISTDIANEAVYYEGVYVMSFQDSDSLNAAICFADESGYEYTTNEVVTICGEAGEVSNQALSHNGTKKVAVIDTGSNNANETVSVLGDDGSDANGHGTSMCNYILSSFPEDIYILSIKAIGDNGVGSATDVYAAVQYAMDKDVDVILMAISMQDTDSTAGLKTLVGSAVSNGITVIAAAGNGNKSADCVTPANIPGVITVGAIDSEGFKQEDSNYGSCVDYYVEASSTSQAAALFTGSYISENIDGIATSYQTPEEEVAVTEASSEGELAIEILPIYEYDDNGFVINGTTVSGNHVRVSWSFGTHYWSSTTRASYRSSILSDLNAINGLSNVEVTFYPQATSGNYSGSQGGYLTNQVLVEFDVESIQDIVGGSSFYNAVTALNAKGDESYAGGVVVINWSTVASAINSNALSSADSSGYTVQTQNGWVRRVCHGPYNRPNTNGTTFCSEPGQPFNDNYTVTVYGSDTSGDVPVAALNGYMAEAAARVLASNQSAQAKQGFVWACKGLTVATAVATDPGADAFPIQQYNGGTVSLNMSTTSPLVNGELFAVPGGTYVFTDANNQIGNYTATSSYSGVSASISGNQLTISVDSSADPAQIKDTTISLECNGGYDGPIETVWHVYAYSSDGQDQINGDYKRQQPHYDATPWSIELVSEVKVDIVKTPSNAAIVAGNSCYSLAGTTYGLYKADNTLVHTFTIDSTGNTDVYTITDLSTSYYVKEITAGPGYYLDTSTYQVDPTKADANSTITFNLQDEPMADPISWSLEKVDSKNWNSVTGLSLAGATFSVSYYDTTNVNSLADALALTSPFETVNLTTTTNAAGAAKITVNSDNLSSVSNYFASFNSYNELPLGTYVVREVSAPNGYNAIPTNAAFVIVVYQGTDGQHHKKSYSTNQYFYSLDEDNAEVYEPEKLGYGSFFKDSTVNSSLSTIAPTLYDLAGTKYEVYYTDSNKLACTITFESSGKMSAVSFPSGVNGVFSYSNQTIELPVGSYYAKEVQTGDGYYLNSGTQSFTITENQTTSVTFDNEPMYADFNLVLSKLVTATGISQEAADLYSVKGAVFSVNYYNEIVPESALATTTPTKAWFFETDANGKIFYTSGYLTSTSYYLDQQGIITLFRDDNGNYVAPQGTYTITEISAPEGLAVNTTTYVRYLTLGDNIVKGSSSDPANSDAWTLTVDGQVIVPETPFVPTVDTVALASDGSKEIAAAPNQTITDTVSYMNLVSGFEYKLNGSLYLTDGTPLGVTAEKSITFSTAGSLSGTMDMDFQLDATGLEGKTIVVFEDLYVIDSNGNEVLFVSHNDLTDADQQITIPDIETTLLDSAIDTWDPNASFGSTYTNSLGYTKHISYGTDVTLTDYVLYTNLVVGYEYTVTGTLKNKDTGADILDSNGNAITGSTTFTATSSDGYVEVLFSGVDTTMLSDVTTVAFETLQRNGIDIVVHADLTDKAQTIPPPPEVKTNATEGAGGTKVMAYAETVTIVDEVSFTGLVPGKTYEVSGNLYNADTGAILLDENGKVISASTTYTASASSGTTQVVFKDVYVPLTVEKVVVFENLYYNGVRIAIHADLNDEDQTVERPKIETTATAEATGTKLMPFSETITLVDEVSFTGLIPGKSYEVTGSLYNADTGAALLDKNGKTITASTTFTASVSDGTAKVVFEDAYVPFDVTKVVVFEELYYEGVKIAIHADLSDKNQTVRRAAASTIAQSDIGKKTVVIGTDATIVDTISYEGLEVGKQYKAVGTLFKKDGTQVLNADGTPVTASTDFIPEAEDGNTTVSLKFNTTGFTEADTVVVFETIYDVAEEAEKTTGSQSEDIEIAEHKDLNDEGQSIAFVQPDIPATGDTIAITTIAGISLIGADAVLIVLNRKKKQI